MIACHQSGQALDVWDGLACRVQARETLVSLGAADAKVPRCLQELSV